MITSFYYSPITAQTLDQKNRPSCSFTQTEIDKSNFYCVENDKPRKNMY